MTDSTKDKKKITMDFAERSAQNIQDEYNEIIVKNSGSTLDIKSVTAALTGKASNKKPLKMAFAEDPQNANNYAGLYKLKKDLLPPGIIKDLSIKNVLVAGILRSRGDAVSAFGRARANRFEVGFEFSIKDHFKNDIEPEQMEMVNDRIQRATKILLNTGLGSFDSDRKDKIDFTEFLKIQTKNGQRFGWFFTEIVRNADSDFCYFRTVDAGTIYRTIQSQEAAGVATRQSSISNLIQLKQIEKDSLKIDLNKLGADEYPWMQVIQGFPKQAFTEKELLCCTLFPSTDIEHTGYPVTPMDTAVTSLITHASIEVYNKLYFQNGRAARGFLVIKSDDIEQGNLEELKQQYMASINNVTNAFRTPIFGVGRADDIQWVGTQPQRRDGEFQFLYDQVTRNILLAFGMSPEELPGYGHLSRGTNSQSMSESSNEYKLNATRDNTIRPLIIAIESFISNQLMQVIDPELMQICDFRLAGFDSETRQQESVRLQVDSKLHYSYDEILNEVKKSPVGQELGGSMPFNPDFQQLLNLHFTEAEILAKFTNMPFLQVDPILKFTNNPNFINWIQTLSSSNPAAFAAYSRTSKQTVEIFKLLLQEYLDNEQEGIS